MSKFHLTCSCVYCRKEVTIQSLKIHNKKCTAPAKNSCGHCGSPTNNPKFCSHSCRAKVVNTERPKKVKIKKPTPRELTRKRFELGEIKERATLRKYIAETTGYCCSVCEVEQWNDQPLTLVVDHIDGNAGNNLPINLRLLCPNCNSQTDTFGGRNKGYGRKARGLPLH